MYVTNIFYFRINLNIGWRADIISALQYTNINVIPRRYNRKRLRE